ncbi:rhodanese-like domain-containing protein [Thermodesulfobacterium hydrogeniphilum]|uniref:rhodanese-like domain-containing protein n=1 Tax=Thermodesulfobacterium hydrogeniphilum TaxID=161156 RepID=UPI00056EC80A|nr:rhodanese-like domain-containing protein [Thermodesulfobacterium hydrogeniphilum]
MSKDIKEVLKKMDLNFFASGIFKILLQEFKEKLLKNEVVLLDVREEVELNYLKFPFGLNIPLKELPERLEEIPKDKEIAVFCPGKIRATMAYLFLLTEGFDKVKILDATSSELASIFKPPYVKKLCNG